MNRISERVARRFLGEEDGYPSSLQDMEKDEGKFVEISFKAKSDAIYSFLELLQHCDFTGNAGHTHPIVIDPDDSTYRNTVPFDGDGPDDIKDIRVNGKEVTRDILDFDNGKDPREE